MRIWHGKRATGERGSVLMETVICLPILLLASLGVAQFGHIWLCRAMLRYAAYSGARATLTAAPGTEQQQANEAAKTVCSVLAFFNPTSSSDFILPGVLNNQKIAASGAVQSSSILRTNVTVDGNGFHTKTEVRLSVPLLVPFAGPVIGGAMRLYENGSFSPSGTPTISGDVFSRIELREIVYMAKPYLCTWPGN